VTIGTEEEMEQFLLAIDAVLESELQGFLAAVDRGLEETRC
jgi:hypothetical protein